MIVPGKGVLQKFRDVAQRRWQVSLTDIRIIDQFNATDMPSGLVTLLTELESFRLARVGSGA
jgi:hypothetical protein